MIDRKITIAALGDIHVKESSRGVYSALFKQMSEKADVAVFAGDLCDLGLAIEAEILAEEIKNFNIPVVAVLGNHDHQSGEVDEVRTILIQSGIHMLGAEGFEMEGIGFAGVKGFGGGFGKYVLGSFGETMMKGFVQETLNEVLALENQLKQIEQEKKIVLMHYSPIEETLVGEPLQIYPFLGSSRLLEPIENLGVNAVFHGHAHHGTYSGKTPGGIPVYNVAHLVMQNINSEQPFALVQV